MELHLTLFALKELDVGSKLAASVNFSVISVAKRGMRAYMAVKSPKEGGGNARGIETWPRRLPFYK